MIGNSHKLLLEMCNTVCHFVNALFHPLAVLMFEIKLKLFQPCLLNYCRMPTHHQNCLGGTPCSHSPQSRDFSNGSKGSLSSAQQYKKFYFPIQLFVYLFRSGPEASSRRVSDSQEITGSMFSFSTSDEGNNGE